LTRAKNLDFRPLRMAIDDLVKTFGGKYPAGQQYRARLVVLERALSEEPLPREAPPPFKGRFALTDKFIAEARREGRE